MSTNLQASRFTAIFALGVLSQFIPQACFAGFSFDLGLQGQIDAAAQYPSLNGYPYNAEFVDQAGSLRLGDTITINTTIRVLDDATAQVDNLSGTINGAIFDWTFGGDPGLPPTVTARHGQPILIPGAFSDPYDSIQIVWSDFREGPGGPTSLLAIMTLYGDPGTLVSPDRRLLATSYSELTDSVDGAILWINTPNSVFTAAFVTDPTYTITPAPGVLAAIGLGGLIVARRRRHTAKETA